MLMGMYIPGNGKALARQGLGRDVIAAMTCTNYTPEWRFNARSGVFRYYGYSCHIGRTKSVERILFVVGFVVVFMAVVWPVYRAAYRRRFKK